MAVDNLNFISQKHPFDVDHNPSLFDKYLIG